MIYAPRGKRFNHGLIQIREKAPIYGGSIALWCGVFSMTSGGLAYYRGVNDYWNMTLGGAVTGFVLNIRGGGLQMALAQALQVGAMFYLIFKTTHNLE
jgi:hypothetical protein